jgi:transposase
MMGPAAGGRIFLACGHTDMRRGMDGLAALVQQAFGQDPFCGAVWAKR